MYGVKLDALLMAHIGSDDAIPLQLNYGHCNVLDKLSEKIDQAHMIGDKTHDVSRFKSMYMFVFWIKKLVHIQDVVT